ncbi:hypothetical protein PGT21_020728 [Puccinia graminis f. sp. tritici]|uniref:Uncharacterized protein n=1 Tax=Puccinia graminis f. sp. tritici TaxID=56615 RepID=A0A5B0N933_PUCGR|nr:hypothetical protein PGT21_020728 [Puccinia graminis f. sp. tritici]
MKEAKAGPGTLKTAAERFHSHTPTIYYELQSPTLSRDEKAPQTPHHQKPGHLLKLRNWEQPPTYPQRDGAAGSALGSYRTRLLRHPEVVGSKLTLAIITGSVRCARAGCCWC